MSYFGAISFCHKSTFTLSLLNPRGQSLSTNILKLPFAFGLLVYILSIFIIINNTYNSRIVSFIIIKKASIII
jgi:hypothetical protein